MNKADQVLKEIEDQSKKIFLPIIGPQKGQVLAHAIKKAKPKKVLEIGTLVGYSAILMAKYLPKNGIITTIEINPQVAKIASQNFKKSGVSQKIDLKIGNAIKLIFTLKGRFDLLFLDAAKEEYITYLKLAEPKLNPKAVIVADNVKIFAEEMSDFLDYVRKSGNYKSQTFDFGEDAVEVSVKI